MSLSLYPCLFQPPHSCVLSEGLDFIRQPRFVRMCFHRVNLKCSSSAAAQLRYYRGRDTLTVEERTPGSNFAVHWFQS